MSKSDKLLEELIRGTISADELLTLLKKLKWIHLRTKGSHQSWGKDGKILVLALHGKDLKRYQINEAQEAIGVSDES